jgi:hypothetical protein
MDRQELFDALTMQWSAGIRERRQVVRTLGRFALAMVVFGAFPWRVVAQEVSPESNLVKGCKLPGQKCHNNQQCCGRKCTGKGRCGCVPKGKKPLVKSPLGPVPVKALCCSNKLNKIKGTCK